MLGCPTSDPRGECLLLVGPAEVLGQPLAWVSSPMEAVAPGRADSYSLSSAHVPSAHPPTVFLDSSFVHLEKVLWACDQVGFQPPPRSHQLCAE